MTQVRIIRDRKQVRKNTGEEQTEKEHEEVLDRLPPGGSRPQQHNKTTENRIGLPCGQFPSARR